MSIRLRCKVCRFFFDPKERSCPKCGEAPPRPPRQYYFRKRWKKKDHMRTTTYLSFREAEQEHIRWLQEIMSSSMTSASFMTMRDLTWHQVAQAYLDKLSAEDKPYRHKCRLFLQRMLDFWGEIPANALTPQMIKEFQVSLREAHASPAYCDRHLAIGKAAWNYSLDPSGNPFARVKFYNPDNTLIRYLTQDEETRLLDAARHPPKPRRWPLGSDIIVLLAIHTGLRLMDILSLHTEETDFNHRMIKIRQKRDLIHIIPMDSEVIDALKRICPPGGGHYFVNPRTGTHYTRFDGTFAKIKEKAGITRPFRFHDLRHHAATKLGRATGNPLLVKAFLGHRNMSTTMRYFHSHLDDLRRAMESLVTTNDAPTTRQRLEAVKKDHDKS